MDVSPTDGKEYEQLSRWLGTQRYRWKQALKKEDGGLSFEQVERLHLLGVTLHRTADRHARISLRKKKLYGQTLQEQIIANQKAVQEWDSMYRQLVSYKNEKGEKRRADRSDEQARKKPKSHLLFSYPISNLRALQGSRHG